MIQRNAAVLSELYEADETAWLDAMAELIEQGRWSDLDYAHLQEYLTDMTGKSYRPTQVCAYPWEGDVRYLAVFVKD